jgi:hypothetical protein
MWRPVVALLACGLFAGGVYTAVAVSQGTATTGSATVCAYLARC